ncbi:MAG TPA: UDP-N-acetylmuramoyl-L-alanine--D-glutamate ligase [Candidatus Acidoferrum sp.]|nr:UDP-N-acetylmuramoyl-L-alanine--D-glutamate ligase [Candidatus Acidoferrum sp.]HUD66042.1 UDP-N-acetylmuramoyl-L-alanine--D-glutamate ligase [Candidatus Sulfotelmatobacter sp.]
MELNGKRVLVVGLGKSGVASALFLKKHGARVTVSDTKSGDELRNEIPVLLDHGITVETGGHGDRTFRGQDLIVVSPGVPVDASPLVQARALGESVIGEIELAAQFLPGPIVAITGSNGKTTTTTLAGEIMTAGGFPALVGGNIGTPAISLAERAKPETVIVLEISSFQLETIQTFRPKIAVVLNVTPDHLDRHRTFEVYSDAKARVLENQQGSDFAVLNADDPTCVTMGTRTRAQVFWFSRQKEVQRGAWVRDGIILFRDQAGQREILQVSEIPLKGAHNLENVLAAVCVGVLMGCAPEKIREAVGNFKAVEHRLEFVATIGGVDYYNDSKATNVDATIKALESFPANIHLILGGKDKGSDYTVLNELLRQRVKRVYTIGAAAAKIESQIKAEVVHAETLENAIRKANAVAQPRDVVLLAPACASFDQFKNYEHRGKVFKDIVRSLAAEGGKA